jgi:hypothetical protein
MELVSYIHTHTHIHASVKLGWVRLREVGFGFVKFGWVSFAYFGFGCVRLY